MRFILRFFERNDALWVSDWLTPVWLIGVGVAVGLIALAIIFFVAKLLSGIPLLGGLFENKKARWTACTIMSLVLLGISLWVFKSAGLNSLVFESPAVGFWFRSFTLNANKVILGLLLLVPACVGCSLLLIALVSKRTIAELTTTLQEGVMQHVTMLLIGFALFGVIATVVVEDPGKILASIKRLPYAGTTVNQHKISPLTLGQADTGQSVIKTNIAGSELVEIIYSSDEPLEILVHYLPDNQLGNSFRISAGEPYRWKKGADALNPIPDETISSFVIHNLGANQANLEIKISTAPEFPESSTVIYTSISVVLLVLFYILHSSLMPRLSAVALATAKSEIAQPLFRILIALGMFLIVMFIWIPYNTFGEDIKMLKDSGLPLILVLGIIQAIWAASMSVSEEVEGRTALTVLSKPIGRRDFILGKFLGIGWSVALLYLILGTTFLVVVSYKMVFDASDSASMTATWQECHFEMICTVPGLLLAFMETIILASVCVCACVMYVCM